MNHGRFLKVVLTASLLFTIVSFLVPVQPGQAADETLAGTYTLRLPLLITSNLARTEPGVSNSQEWILTFEDEFNQPSLDREVWGSEYGNGSNGELQQYVPDDSRGNYPLVDGALHILAKKEATQGRSYSSGIITTRDRFFQKYGRFEMRARLPQGQGLWPAFWLMPNPSGWPPEIDVMESLGHQTDVVYMSLHYRDAQNERAWTTSAYQGEDFSSGWHTFAIEWSPDAIAWFVNGIERKRITDPALIPHLPMFILANLAVGGHWPGSPDSSTEFPAAFQIDYIRAWQHASRYTPPVQTDNGLKNPSFDDPESYPWHYPWSMRNDLSAVFTQAPGGPSGSPYAIKASLPQKNADQPWVVSLNQGGLSLQAGQTYTLTFWARASQPRTLRAILQEQSSPYSEYFAQTVDLTTTWQLYTYTFTAPTSTREAKVSFNLAGETGEVWLDEVGLR